MERIRAITNAPTVSNPTKSCDGSISLEGTSESRGDVPERLLNSEQCSSAREYATQTSWTTGLIPASLANLGERVVDAVVGTVMPGVVVASQNANSGGVRTLRPQDAAPITSCASGSIFRLFRLRVCDVSG